LGLISDHELVAAVRRGDDRAFEKLYERYQRRIAAYVYGMVNDYGRAEDITQEVFISALRRMRETERPIAFKPWIYEIAKNACIDQFRRSRRAEEVSIDADEGLGASDTAKLHSVDCTPDAAIDTKQTLDNLCGAFGGLSETHHEILVLRELEGLSYREIGEKMGLSRPSVESTLFRARRRLTEEYDELVSGERCHRIQGIIVTAGGSALGARDQRRLQRHIAHCQPCRREARLAGLETGVLARPVRDVVAAKVAAFLPFPFLFRGRKGADSVAANWTGPIATMSEPMVAGWSKAATAAAILVAGAGAGGLTTVGNRSADVKAPSTSGAAALKSAAKPAAAAPAAAKPASRTTRKAASGGAAKKKNATSGVTGTAGSGAKAPSAAGPASSGPVSLPSSPPAKPSDIRVAPPEKSDGDSGTPTEVPARLSPTPLKDAEDAAKSVNPALGDAVGTLRQQLGG
jgi:RNA polymerase sigma factor (sigma-70 family)